MQDQILQVDENMLETKLDWLVAFSGAFRPVSGAVGVGPA